MNVSATSTRPPVANGPGAVAVGENAADRPRGQEPDGERDHVDAGPQRRLREAVAVQREPDPLQPDDQHEHETAPAQRGEEAGHVAGREGADAEEREAEHRLGHLGLDDPEEHQDRHAPEDLRQHDGAGPPHGVPAVGQEAVGDPDQDEDQADGEGDVAQPVDLGRRAHPSVLELHVRPGRAEDAERAPRSRRRGATPPGPAGHRARAR